MEGLSRSFAATTLLGMNRSDSFGDRLADDPERRSMSKQTSDLVITPKRLGLIRLAKYCARCFWYRLKLRFRPPFDMFGGAIFKQAEQAQMAVFGSLLE